MKCDTVEFYIKLIDRDRLKVLPPLKLGQIPPKEDLLYLYDELNLNSQEVAHFYSRSDSRIQQWCKIYGYIKPKEKILLAKQRRSLWLYGVEDPSKRKETRDKYRKTCLEKYGTDNVFSSEIGKKKIKETNLKKYGVEHNHQCSEVINKMKETFLRKYGCECSLGNPEIHKKAQDTWTKNLGVNNPAKNIKIIEKIKQTNIKRFGKSYFAQTKEFQELQQKHKDKWVSKAMETMKKNNTYCKSKSEDKIYGWLCEKFPEVIRQYKSEKYPFYCDFYIPSKDLYIEYNGHWTHGGFPFDENNPRAMKQANEWLDEFIQTGKKVDGLQTWMIRDVAKREVAKTNKLNYLEFFNIKEFRDWFRNIS